MERKIGWEEEAEVERTDRNLFGYFIKVWTNWPVVGTGRRLMDRRDLGELASGNSLMWG